MSASLARSARLDDPSGHRRTRHRRIAAAAGAAMAAKVVSVGVALISVPLTLHYLGTERYGMWLVLSSLLAMLSFADLGIGNGVVGRVAAAYGRDDLATIRRTVSSALAALCGVAVLAIVTLALLYRHVAWPSLFNVRTPLASAEAGPAVAVFVVCTALAIPLGIVQRVQMGLQLGFLASLWQCLGSALTLAGLLAAIGCRAGLPWLVLAFVGGPLLANVANCLVFFCRSRRDLAPRPAAARLADAGQALRLGSQFVLIQLGNTVTAGCAPLIVAQIVGPAAVAAYAVPERLLALVVMLTSMSVQPLWPAYREALERGDAAWVARAYRRILAVVLIGGAVALVAIGGAMPLLLREWVGSTVRPPMLLVWGLCIYKLAECALWTNATLLNGLDALRVQSAMALVTAVGVVGTGLWVCRAWGVAALPWSSAAILATASLVPGFLAIRRSGAVAAIGPA